MKKPRIITVIECLVKFQRKRFSLLRATTIQRLIQQRDHLAEEEK